MRNCRYSSYLRRITHVLLTDQVKLDMNYGRGDFHICPIAAGAGIEWAAFFVVMLFVAAATYLMMPNIAPNDRDGTEEDTSYLFGGRLNSGNQGQVIPLIYGEVYTGSIVISQGMKAIEVI